MTLGSGALEERPTADPAPISTGGMLHVDGGGHCLCASESWCEFTRLLPHACLGLGWLKVFSQKGQTALLGYLESQPPRQFSCAITLLVPIGFSQEVWCDGLPIPDNDGGSSSYALAFRSQPHPTTGELSQHWGFDRGAEERGLHCLLKIPRIVESTGGMSIEGILNGIVEVLPSSLRFPEVAYARATLDGDHFGSLEEVPTPAWAERAEIMVYGKSAGYLERGYSSFPAGGLLPSFRKGKGVFIGSVAQRMGRMVERILDAKRVREKDEELRATMTHMTRVAIVGEMAANIAHELNQPLSAIATLAQTSNRMLNGQDTDLSKIGQALSWIGEESLRGGEIIERLLNLTRKKEIRRKPSDVNELIRSLEHLATGYARRHRVRLLFDLSPQLPRVKVDAVQIQQVVLNLVKNGVDAVRDGAGEEGRVLVRTGQRSSGDVQVSVEDNGPGFPKELADNLFQPFSSTKKDGVGLGLSISRTIVEAHGGKIGYSPRPERGMVFFFSVPQHAC